MTALPPVETRLEMALAEAGYPGRTVVILSLPTGVAWDPGDPYPPDEVSWRAREVARFAAPHCRSCFRRIGPGGPIQCWAVRRFEQDCGRPR